MATETRLPVRSVRRSLKRLAGRGHLRIEERFDDGGERHARNLYVPLWRPDEGEDAPTDAPVDVRNNAHMEMGKLMCATGTLDVRKNGGLMCATMRTDSVIDSVNNRLLCEPSGSHPAVFKSDSDSKNLFEGKSLPTEERSRSKEERGLSFVGQPLASLSSGPPAREGVFRAEPFVPPSLNWTVGVSALGGGIRPQLTARSSSGEKKRWSL